MNINLKELSLPHDPNTRFLNGVAKIRQWKMPEKSFLTLTIYTGGYTGYCREPLRPVCPCNDARTTRKGAKRKATNQNTSK